jgi:phage host-nuclease inhibitor protein Gam
MKLYEVTKELDTAIQKYNSVESQDELDALEKVLTDLQMTFNDKAKQVALYTRNIDADVEAVKAEIERLNGLKEGLVKHSEWLKSYIFNQMLMTDTREIDGQVIKLKIKKCPPSVIVEDEGLIPDSFKRVIPERKEPDKVAIKESWKKGVGVTGTRIDDSKERLDIK